MAGKKGNTDIRKRGVLDGLVRFGLCLNTMPVISDSFFWIPIVVLHYATAYLSQYAKFKAEDTDDIWEFRSGNLHIRRD